MEKAIKIAKEVVENLNQPIGEGIDISSVAPRLEVKDNEVFLIPEQPATNPKEHCPTCGAKVKIVGENTLHYEPVEEDQEEIWLEIERLIFSHLDYPATLLKHLKNAFGGFVKPI